MTLIIQIALGVVLGGLILAFLPRIISAGLWLLIATIAAVALGFIGYFAYENLEVIFGLFLFLIIVLISYAVFASIGKITDLVDKSISPTTERYWDITFGQLIASISSVCLFLAGTAVVAYGIFFPDFFAAFGAAGMFASIIAAFWMKRTTKDIKRKRDIRAIRATYSD